MITRKIFIYLALLTCLSAISSVSFSNINYKVFGDKILKVKCPPADSLALRELYLNTGGWTTWTVKWDSSQRYRTWPGVTVDAAGCVTALNLQNRGLKGNLPASLRNLNKLVTLNLSQNRLTGKVPGALFALTGITTINLSQNEFTGIDVTPLLPSSTLTTVRLANNKMTYESFEPNMALAFFSDSVAYAPQKVLTSDTTIIRNDGDALNYVLAVGGTSNIYQWFKNNVSTGPAASGNNALNFPDIRTSDAGRYLLRVTNPAVPNLTLFSGIVTLRVLPCFISKTIIEKSQSVCEGQPMPTLTGAAATGAKGTLRYQWQRSADKITWINTGTTQNFTPTVTTLSDSTFFRRISADDRCISDTSNIIRLTYLRKIGNNIISASQEVCPGRPIARLTGTVPNGGDNIFTYQWQSSANQKQWKDEDKAKDFQPTIIRDTLYLRRIVINSCGKDTSNVVRITVYPALARNIIGKDQQVCRGGNALVLRDTAGVADSLRFRYQWQVSANRTTWIRADTARKADTLYYFHPKNVTRELYYRRIMKTPCDSSISNVVRLTFYPNIVNNVIESSFRTFCEGDTTSLKLTGAVPQGGGGKYTYTWQSSLDKKNWNNRSDSAGFAFSNLSDTTYFRRIVKSLCYSDTSNTLLVNAVYLFGDNTIGPRQINCVGDSSALIKGTKQRGKGSFVFEWQTSPDSVNWSKIDTLGNFQNYAPGRLQEGVTFLRRIIRNGCKPDTSNVIDITMVNPIEGNDIERSYRICEGDTVPVLKGGKLRGGGGNYTFEWQTSADQKNWVLAAKTDQFKPQQVVSTTHFRRIVSGIQCGTDTSEVVTVTVINKITGNVIRDNQDLCIGQAADSLRGTIPPNADSTIVYAWQSSADGKVWQSVAATRSFKPVVRQTTRFRRIVFLGNCFADTSNVVTINVNYPIKNNFIADSSRQIICQKSKPDTLIASTPDDGVGIFKYQWQVSRDRKTWQNIPNSNIKNLVPSSPDTTSFYRRIVSNLCFSDTSASQTIRVLPLPKIYAGRDTIVTIGLPIQLHATGAVEYLWSPAGSLSDSTSASPVARPIRTTRYVVRGRDASGCYNYDSVIVVVAEEPAVRVVEVLTPSNRDGVNDNFFIEGLENYPETTLIVFNRYGKEIFQQKNYNNDWNCTFNGATLPTGVYFYMLKFEITSQVLNGTFTILE